MKNKGKATHFDSLQQLCSILGHPLLDLSNAVIQITLRGLQKEGNRLTFSLRLPCGRQEGCDHSIEV